MAEYCCHILGKDPATGDVTELFHTHVDVPIMELGVPLVMLQAARRNVDLSGATAVAMEFIQPLDAETLQAYEQARQQAHPGTQGQPASADPAQGPGTTAH